MRLKNVVITGKVGCKGVPPPKSNEINLQPPHQNSLENTLERAENLHHDCTRHILIMCDDAAMSCISCTTFFANEELETDLYSRPYEKASTMKQEDCQLHHHIKHNDLLRQIVASTIGTAVSVMSLNPISVMKIMIQREDSLGVTSLREAYKTIRTTQGLRGFWAGASTGNYYLDSGQDFPEKSY